MSNEGELPPPDHRVVEHDTEIDAFSLDTGDEEGPRPGALAAHENPIQRPPPATPNHRANETSAVSRPTCGRSEVMPDSVTRR